MSKHKKTSPDLSNPNNPIYNNPNLTPEQKTIVAELKKKMTDLVWNIRVNKQDRKDINKIYTDEYLALSEDLEQVIDDLLLITQHKGKKSGKILPPAVVDELKDKANGKEPIKLVEVKACDPDDQPN